MYKQIRDYLARDIYPFHMPGHKRNPQFMPPNLYELDLTEIPGMDVLSTPTGMIYDLQQKIANFYGADHSFFLVNGSSAGIIAAICATCADGDTLVVPRNAHASVYNGMVLSGAVPMYIMPQFTTDGLAGGICPSALDDMPQGAAVLVVSPTYEGFVSDIQAIAQKVHSRGGILIIDEAHGAHFAFHKRFPVSALQLGADIVVQSLHKTLPAPSQCAVLHVKNGRVDVNRIKFLINAVQTSSPSYILMAVCDFVLQKLWQQPELFDAYVERLDNFRAAAVTSLRARPAIFLTHESCRSSSHEVKNSAIFATDPGKLLFTTPYDAETIAQAMAREYKVQVEMAAGRYILAMTSVADTDEGFDRLKRAIVGYGQVVAKTGVCNGISAVGASPRPTANLIPEMVIPPREAVRMPSLEIPWEEAAGQISAQLIAKYPPGIAIVAPGERIPHSIDKQSETIRIITSSRPVAGNLEG